jgi:hypothetical protein
MPTMFILPGICIIGNGDITAALSGSISSTIPFQLRVYAK